MVSAVSPVMAGEGLASPQPTSPLELVNRTNRLVVESMLESEIRNGAWKGSSARMMDMPVTVTWCLDKRGVGGDTGPPAGF